jgi:ketosteroid isomerase-like protein
MIPSVLKRGQYLPAYVFIFSLALIFQSCVTEIPGPTAEEAEKAVIGKEKEALDNWSAGNPAGFAIHVADDITYMDDIGASNRMSGIEACNNYLASLEGMIPPHDYEIVNPLVQLYGNIAILTFQYHGSVDGQPGQPWKATSVYNYTDGDWKMVHANWSLIKMPEAEAEGEAEAPAEAEE